MTGNVDLTTLIKFPDGYQRLGKAMYGDKWIDYNIAVYKDGRMQVTNLSQFLMKDDALNKIQEIRWIDDGDIKQLKFRDATGDEKEIHGRVKDFFDKGVRWGDVLYANNEPILQNADNNTNDKKDVIKSVFIKTGDKILISPSELAKQIKAINRRKADKQNTKGGRHASIPWKDYDEWLVDICHSMPAPLNKTKCAEKLIHKVKENKDTLLQANLEYSLNDIMPAPDTVTKRIRDFIKSGRISLPE